MASPYPTRGIVAAASLSALYADGEVFPGFPGRDWIVSKTPSWSTVVKTAASGSEVRGAWYSAPRYSFKLDHPVLRDRTLAQLAPFGSEVDQLVGFFNARRGKYGFFYFYDPSDNAATLESIGAGDGATTSFQLTRTVGIGSPFSSVEPVYALWGNPVLTVAGATKSPAAAATATITLSTNPAAGNTVTITPVGTASAVKVTFVASGAAGMQCNIGATATSTTANLLTLLQNNDPIGGTGGAVVQSSTSNSITLAAWTPGTWGNGIALAKTGTAVALSGANFTGGAANDYVVNPWGMVAFTTAPAIGSAIAWSGTFLFVCRFDTDTLEFKQLVRDLWEQKGLPFISIFP